MSQPFEAIPPDRMDAYLQHAKEAVDMAAEAVVEPAVMALGELVLKEAVDLTRISAEGAGVGDDLGSLLPKQNSISVQMDNIARGRRPSSEMMKRIAQNRNDPQFKDFRRSYTTKGLQNQLWFTMAEQNETNSHDKDAGSS
jgi:hypothetical protein